MGFVMGISRVLFNIDCRQMGVGTGIPRQKDGSNREDTRGPGRSPFPGKGRGGPVRSHYLNSKNVIKLYWVSRLAMKSGYVGRLSAVSIVCVQGR